MSSLAGRHDLIAWLRAAPRAEKEKELLRVREEEVRGFGRCDAGGPNFQLALAAGSGLASVDGVELPENGNLVLNEVWANDCGLDRFLAGPVSLNR